MTFVIIALRFIAWIEKQISMHKESALEQCYGGKQRIIISKKKVLFINIALTININTLETKAHYILKLLYFKLS